MGLVPPINVTTMSVLDLIMYLIRRCEVLANSIRMFLYVFVGLVLRMST